MPDRVALHIRYMYVHTLSQIQGLFLSPLSVMCINVSFPIDGWGMIIKAVICISNNVVCVTSKGSDQPAHTRSLIRAFPCRLNIL